MQLLARYAKTRKLREDPEMGPVFQTWFFLGPGNPPIQFQWILTCFLTKNMALGGHFDPVFMGKLLISVKLCNFWHRTRIRGNCEKIPKWGLFFGHGLFLGPGTPPIQFQWLLTCFLTKNMALGGHFDPGFMGKFLISVKLCNFWHRTRIRGNCEKIPKWACFSGMGSF